MRPISVHHVTALDLSVELLIDVAAASGCDHLCLFTQQPGDLATLPVIGDSVLSGVRRRMDDAGLTALSVTSFPILPGLDADSYKAGLARGTALGATIANARVLDPDLSRAADTFARFAELCEIAGLAGCIEFTGYNRPAALAEALALVRHAGRGAVTVDPLHIVRSGVPWHEVEALSAEQIGYVQLCDGMAAGAEDDYLREQISDRLPLGEGEFPLAELLAVVPAEMPVTLEIPCQRLREQGYDAAACVAELVTRARRYLARLS